MSEDRGGYVYVLRAAKPFEHAYKIGRTIDPKTRLHTFAVRLPYKVEPVLIVRVGDCQNDERAWHNQFHEKRIDGEWFRLAEIDVELMRRGYLFAEALTLVGRLYEMMRPQGEFLRWVHTDLEAALRMSRTHQNALRRLARRWVRLKEVEREIYGYALTDHPLASNT